MSLINIMLRDLDRQARLEPEGFATMTARPVPEMQSGSLAAMLRQPLKFLLFALCLWIFYQLARPHDQLPVSHELKILGQPVTAGKVPQNIGKTPTFTAEAETPRHAPSEKTIARPSQPQKTAPPPLQKSPKSPVTTATQPARPRQPPVPRQRQSASPKQQAAASYALAKKSNNPGRVRTLLEETIRQEPRHLEARIDLTRILLQQGHDEEAADLLDQSLQLFPENLQLIKARARLFIQNRDLTAALTTLRSASLPEDRDETYLSLLAAVYQQLQKHDRSAEIYRHLLQTDPEKAENWLGLAISLEQTGDAKNALYAYRRALDGSPLPGNIVTYIQQRIVVLK